jgi:hypothetical protein
MITSTAPGSADGRRRVTAKLLARDDAADET